MEKFITAIQAFLYEHGYLHHEPNGEWNTATQASFTAYAESQNLHPVLAQAQPSNLDQVPEKMRAWINGDKAEAGEGDDGAAEAQATLQRIAEAEAAQAEQERQAAVDAAAAAEASAKAEAEAKAAADAQAAADAEAAAKAAEKSSDEEASAKRK